MSMVKIFLFPGFAIGSTNVKEWDNGLFMISCTFSLKHDSVSENLTNCPFSCSFAVLSWWHALHNTCKLCSSFVPPFESGLTWSMSYFFPLRQYSHVAHLFLVLSSTSCLKSLLKWILPLSSSKYLVRNYLTTCMKVWFLNGKIFFPHNTCTSLKVIWLVSFRSHVNT